MGSTTLRVLPLGVDRLSPGARFGVGPGSGVRCPEGVAGGRDDHARSLASWRVFGDAYEVLVPDADDRGDNGHRACPPGVEVTVQRLRPRPTPPPTPSHRRPGPRPQPGRRGPQRPNRHGSCPLTLPHRCRQACRRPRRTNPTGPSNSPKVNHFHFMRNSSRIAASWSSNVATSEQSAGAKISTRSSSEGISPACNE